MESPEEERVYVAIGADFQDDFTTLQWALNNWALHPVTIVILYISNTNLCKDYVYTPLGKLPSVSVNEEKLKSLDKIEEAKTQKILDKLVASCGKVKAAILKIEKYDEPIHKVIVELISSCHITKLVIGFTFLRSISWKLRSSISASLYVHRHKPDFCELFIICDGKLVYLREENNQAFVEDDRGVVIAKLREKNGIKGWLGKISGSGKLDNERSPSSSTIDGPSDQWETCREEIEHYFNHLLSLIALEEECEVDNESRTKCPANLEVPENKGEEENVELMKTKIRETREIIQLKRKEAKANFERHEKAMWAISQCTSRIDQLEAWHNELVGKRVNLEKMFVSTKEELSELQTEVEQRRTKLSSIQEIQGELSEKLQFSSLAKSRAEIQLERGIQTRTRMLQEIEELRRQRDVFQRRIEFCRDKDSIERATKLNELGFSYREFSAAEIRAATGNFSDRSRFKSSGDWTNVYKGRINHVTVAIKLYACLSPEVFHAKVKLLSCIQHRHLVAMIGLCYELKCIVFEYMSNGCLRDTLFSRHRSSRTRANSSLSWHARIRVAAEVCGALSFLHQSKPRCIVHGSLNPSKILLDHKNVAKIQGFEHSGDDQTDTRQDIRAFGNLVLQLLTGRNWAGMVEEALTRDHGLVGVLDQSAGEWPMDLAVELTSIAVRCLSCKESLDGESITELPMRDIDEVRRKADELIATGEYQVATRGLEMGDSFNVPSIFLCPIYQDIMKNPHVAADGFSYELEAIEQWLRNGHDTSPMTNLKLKHKLLAPNRALLSLIQDWQHRKCTQPA